VCTAPACTWLPCTCSLSCVCTCVQCLHMCAQHLPPLGCPAPAPWDVSFYLIFRVAISMHSTCHHLAALHLLPELCLHMCAMSTNVCKAPAIPWLPCYCSLGCVVLFFTWSHHKCAQHLPAHGCLAPAPYAVPAPVCCAYISVHSTCHPLAALHLLPGMCLPIYYLASP